MSRLQLPAGLQHQPSEVETRRFDRSLGKFRARWAPGMVSSDADKLLSDLRWRSHLLMKTLSEPHAPGAKARRLQFEFMDAAEVNAVAAPCRGDRFIVSMTTGLVQAAYRAAYATLATPDRFPSVGVAGKEVERSGDVARLVFGPCDPAGTTTWDDDRALLPSAAFTPVLPRCAIRQEFAHFIASALLQFVLYHEFYHAWHGHALHLRQRGVRHRLFEHTGKRATRHAGLLHLLECDADQMAALRVAGELVSGNVMLAALRFDQFPLEARLEGLAFMLSVLFHLLATTPRSLKEFAGLDHPHPEVRYWCAKSAAEAQLRQPEFNVASLWDPAVKAANASLADLWRASGHRMKEFPATREDVETIVGEANRLTRDSSKLREELRDFWATQMLAIP